jgi:zeaxanthin epoxidase
LKGSTAQLPLRVIIAGGGLGGLALASNLIRKGFDVHVFEQTRQYKPFGGPIQIQSNALWALKEINPVLYSAVAEVGVQTGDRLSGIKDGLRYEEGWLVKFDATTPAIRRGLPLTLAVNRVVLQEIFLKYGVPEERVHTGNRVMGYENLDHGIAVHLQDGRTVYGDVLVGADGIWSRVRHQIYKLPSNEVGPAYATKHAKYSGYTCYTGTCRHTPDDIDHVAYKVFLGQQQYLGCTDCGHGWQHWWAFLPDPPGKTDSDEPMLERLKREFKEWSPEIHDLFKSTRPEVVKRRDLFDRPPLLKGWSDGFVTLMGDAAHPTMPNLGQGGAMAIEDAYVFGEEFEDIQHTDEIPARLKAYEKRRFLRASIAQFLSRNGSDLLVDWETLRTTPIIGPIAMWFINIFQPITMNYLYSADF